MMDRWKVFMVILSMALLGCGAAQKKPDFMKREIPRAVPKEIFREIPPKVVPGEIPPKEIPGRELFKESALKEAATAPVKDVQVLKTVEIRRAGDSRRKNAEGNKTAPDETLKETLRLMNNNPMAALNLFKPANAIDAGRWEFYYNSGLLYLRMGEMEKAQEKLLDALKFKAPPAKIYNALGTFYDATGRPEKAIESFNGSLMLEKSVSAMVNIANAYLRTGRAKEAEKFYNDAGEIDPANPVLHYNMGVFLYSEGNYPGALERFTRAIDNGKRDALTLSGKAQALAKLRRYDEALKAFEEMRDINPEDPRPYRNMGIIYEIYLEDMDKALENYDVYLKKGGKDSKDVSAWIDVVKARLSMREKKGGS